MKKVVRLTESDLVRLVKRVIQEEEKDDFNLGEYFEKKHAQVEKEAKAAMDYLIKSEKAGFDACQSFKLHRKGSNPPTSVCQYPARDIAFVLRKKESRETPNGGAAFVYDIYDVTWVRPGQTPGEPFGKFLIEFNPKKTEYIGVKFMPI